MSLYIQYGCGLSSPDGWVNFDSSPTLKLQKIPVFGKLVKKVNFPSSVLFGDITKKLPNIKVNTCDGIYCSHVLEHLSLEDFRIALKNTYDLLKVGGTFRSILPDLESAIDEYVAERAAGNNQASLKFIETTLLGINSRPKGLKAKIISLLGNSHHLWMWDKYSLERELIQVGFKHVRQCKFNDSKDLNFIKVEDSGRFYNAVAFEAIK
jgi:SAM-dependent methyltransferase